MAKTTEKADADKHFGPLPEQEEQKLLGLVRAFASEPRFEHAREALRALCQFPPQSLMLEGGTADARLGASLYWGTLLNCPKSAKADRPCLECPVCLRFTSGKHRDLFLFDGRKGSIKIADVREMRTVLGEPPREANARVIIFAEGQYMGDEAANSLLKSLEEPRPGSVFTLTTPQRERLLPTLISRSWVLALPWSDASAIMQQQDEDLALTMDWSQAMLNFAKSGKGWMQRTSQRGLLNAALAMRLVLFCQSSLAQAISGTISGTTPMSESFSLLSEPGRKILIEVLAECQDSLNYGVNPSLTMDWLATKLFFLFSQDKITAVQP